ncbi:MAG: SulP family inorganic anion transporter [Deltaproteobacteria bacterium]|nr:SulP family inorganic anion transporter [Deltaproteobacteria bacterium]
MLNKIFPFLSWFKDYSLNSFRLDAISGLTVALVLIPQSMAYAQLAGLPPYYGLYASFLPPMIAALFGSSRQLATGPVAIVSLMTAASLEPLAASGSPGFIAYAILLALMVGVFQFALGILKLGLVVNFLSHPVVNGFTNAGAIIIASSQLSKLFGVDVDSGAHHYETIIRVIQAALHYTHWPTLLMGVFAFAIMYGLKWISPKIPNVLVAVVITTLISWGFGFENNIKTDIDQIASPDTVEVIDKFNKEISRTKELTDSKSFIFKEIEEAHSNHDALNALKSEQKAGITDMHIEEAKEKAHMYRSLIREFLFSAVKSQDGSLRFFLKNEIPDGAEIEGHTWRIKAGNSPIDLTAIKMTGGGAVVGDIPKGLPSLSIPKIDFRVIGHLLPYAIIISLLGFMEAISIAKAMAGKTGQRLNPDRELIGQGLANILGAIGKSYPTSGSFSRSAVNLQSGAVTGLSSVFTSVAVVVVLMFFTPLLYHLPQPVLASIIMMAVIGLINVSGFVHAWEAQWYDGLISIITFICTLIFAPHLDRGIMIGVILSLLVFLYKSMRPGVASLARAEDQAFRCAEAHGLKECEYIAMIRFDGPLFFANESYLEDEIMKIMKAKPNLRHIIIVSNGINDIDASGQETLTLLVDRIRSAGLDISLSGINETVMEVLKRTHFIEKIGDENLFPTMEKAIEKVYDRAHRQSEETVCPLKNVCYLTDNIS